MAFYLNRAARIYPPYLASALLACAVLVVVATLVPHAMTGAPERELNPHLLLAWQNLLAFRFSDFLRTIGFLKKGELYTGYNEVYWSLLPEVLFYLGVPLFFWRIRIYYFASILLYAASFFNHTGIGLENPVSGYLLVYNFYFALGALLYDVVVQTEWLNLVRGISGKVIIGVAFLLFGIMLGTSFLKLKAVSGLLAALLATLSISALLADKVSPRNLLVRIMRTIGLFSFSLYLYHFPLLVLCYAGLVWLTGDLVFYARYYWLAVPLVTLVSYGLYWITERVSVNYFRKV